MAPGQWIEYEWYAKDEGARHISDGADMHGGEEHTQSQGLFGALSVGPPGSEWSNSANYEVIRAHIEVLQRSLRVQENSSNGWSRWSAVVHPPAAGPSYPKVDWLSVPEKHHGSYAHYRDFVVIFHDEVCEHPVL